MPMPNNPSAGCWRQGRVDENEFVPAISCFRLLAERGGGYSEETISTRWPAGRLCRARALPTTNGHLALPIHSLRSLFASHSFLLPFSSLFTPEEKDKNAVQLRHPRPGRGRRQPRFRQRDLRRESENPTLLLSVLRASNVCSQHLFSSLSASRATTAASPPAGPARARPSPSSRTTSPAPASSSAPTMACPGTPA